MNVNIIEALSAIDIGILSKTAKEIWNEYFPFLLSQDQIDYMLDKFLSYDVLIEQMQEGYEYYLALDDDNAIEGFFVIHPEKDKLFLSKMYLSKDYRNKGASTPMFDFIENRAQELGLNKIYLTVNKYNKQPMNVYRHRGFEVVDSVVTDIGEGFVMDDFIMEKTL